MLPAACCWCIYAFVPPPEVDAVQSELSANNAALFAYLPATIRKQLLADRDSHGNVQVSKIQTENLLAETVQRALERLRTKYVDWEAGGGRGCASDCLCYSVILSLALCFCLCLCLCLWLCEPRHGARRVFTPRRIFAAAGACTTPSFLCSLRF